jgi:hypothetical protein
MSTTMNNPACGWVRGRLPLWTGVGDDANDSSDDGGDLSVEDRRSIDRHLKGCLACRAHRARLSRVMDALAAAAGSLPIAPDAPSLWPSLERRIGADPAGGELRHSRGWETAAERESAWASLDGERPLRSAWIQDTLGEVLDAAGLGTRCNGSGKGRGSRTWGVVGASLAASVLALLVVLPASWRQRARAEAILRDNAAPVARMVVPTAEPEVEAQNLAKSGPEDDKDVPPAQLAQADPIRPPADPTPTPTPAADAAPSTKAVAPTRFGYDLEHGTLTPPDGRDTKPVY